MDHTITNARIYTSNPEQPWADVAVVRDGRFTFVGTEADLGSSELPPAYAMGGKVVLPGLIDSHTHLGAVAKSGWHVALPWTDDISELLAFVRDYGAAHPVSDAPFVYFEYYQSTLFADGGPTRELLDSAISDRPVLCQDFSEHACWVNSRMLELMEVNRDTPDPIPGLETFARDANGEPTGHLLEGVWRHFADKMYDNLGWRPPQEVTVDNLGPVLRFLSGHGVTALFEAVLEDEATLQAVADLNARGELGLHYQAALRFEGLHDLPDALSKVRSYEAKFGCDRIRVQAVKLFLDGTNESGNSAVLDPLVIGSGAGERGAMKLDVDELSDCLLLCNPSQVDVHIHMVGDRAFRTGCDAVAAAQAQVSAAGDDWRVQVTFAHCELIDPIDMSRPAELGIIVNWTPHWSAGYFGEESKRYLGDDRWNRMYAFNEIATSGAILAFSSDVVTQYELHRANPFFGMQAASTRVDPEYPLDPERYSGSIRPSASSMLSVERLIRGYTIDGARQLRIDDQVGSIEVGKRANFVVLTDDLFAADRSSIREIRPSAVVFEGNVVSGAL
jgi:hypothetical protein